MGNSFSSHLFSCLSFRCKPKVNVTTQIVLQNDQIIQKSIFLNATWLSKDTQFAPKNQDFFTIQYHELSKIWLIDINTKCHDMISNITNYYILFCGYFDRIIDWKTTLQIPSTLSKLVNWILNSILMGVETISWKMYVNMDLKKYSRIQINLSKKSIFQPYVVVICKVE
jgi:hypothetical protein